MKDDYKLQLAIYTLLLNPKEDVLIIFKGENEKMIEKSKRRDAIDALLYAKIADAILRPATKQKVWVTTASSIKDDEFVKKINDTKASPLSA